jgi:hypothetical protein
VKGFRNIFILPLQKNDMKRISFLFVFAVLTLTSFAQGDLIVINNDTIKCKIHENSLDWVSYVSNGLEYRFSKNLKSIKNGDTITTFADPVSVNYVKFFKTPQQSYTTQDLLKKIDFTLKSPHLKYSFNADGSHYELPGFDTSNNKLYWFGLDFSQVVIQLGNATRTQFSDLFFSDCNDFVLKDDRFKEFRECFNFVIDTGFVINRNSKINFNTIYNKNPIPLPLETIRNIISSFSCNYKGVGVIVFYKEINKESENMTFYLTFFDIQSKNILLCLKEKSQTGGIGMGWHWTKPINEYLNKLFKNSDWTKRYQ